MFAGDSNSKEFAALRDHGKTTEAEITKLEWTEKKRTHNDSGYKAHVRFTTEDGRTIQTEVHIKTEIGRAWRNKSVPSTMTVRYLPEAPSTLQDINREDHSGSQKEVGLYMLLAGLAIMIIRFFLARHELRRERTHSGKMR
ncbi:hypothetical protein FACS1894185_3250 [Betaproteobacteria bacterium]|nr:hypothetical protein FACS1894185_3250 [Betaproteobacteria bacterium]